jgi:hypothetical protein
MVVFRSALRSWLIMSSGLWLQVAVMERQMKKLEQDVAGSDGKPSECMERDHLKRQVQNQHSFWVPT